MEFIEMNCFAVLIPVTIAILVYFVRLEKKITSISKDVEYIKKDLLICQQP